MKRSIIRLHVISGSQYTTIHCFEIRLRQFSPASISENSLPVVKANSQSEFGTALNCKRKYSKPSIIRHHWSGANYGG